MFSGDRNQLQMDSSISSFSSSNHSLTELQKDCPTPDSSLESYLPEARRRSKLNDGDLGKHIELFLNLVNHICIGFVAIYMSLLCFRLNLAKTALHAWLVTIGFSLLMAEAVMCHYDCNTLTFSYKRKTKTKIHWILQALGGGCGLAGGLIKSIEKGFLFKSLHGKLGLAACILCSISFATGLSAFFSQRLKHHLKPLNNKAIHNFLGLATFVLAMGAQFYGYRTGFFVKNCNYDFRQLMKAITLASLVLTCVGPLKSLYYKCLTICLRS